MKKHHKGRVYDTDKAAMVARRSQTSASGLIREGDPAEIVTTMYRKRTGEYFLHMEDIFYETIVPLSFEEAKEWAEKNGLSEEAFEGSIYEPADDGRQKEGIYMTLPKDLIFRLRRMAAMRNETISKIVQETICKGMREEEINAEVKEEDHRMGMHNRR